jgi:hypothetical protein
MLAAEMPESNLANLLGSHGIDVSDWKFVN